MKAHRLSGLHVNIFKGLLNNDSKMLSAAAFVLSLLCKYCKNRQARIRHVQHDHADIQVRNRSSDEQRSWVGVLGNT